MSAWSRSLQAASASHTTAPRSPVVWSSRTCGSSTTRSSGLSRPRAANQSKASPRIVAYSHIRSSCGSDGCPGARAATTTSRTSSAAAPGSRVTATTKSYSRSACRS